MSERSDELKARHAELLLRCAAQRRAMGEQVAGIEARLGRADRVAGIVRQFVVNPIVVLAGAAALLTLGRARGLHFIGRVALLVTAVRRFWQVAKTL